MIVKPVRVDTRRAGLFETDSQIWHNGRDHSGFE
jgi:hypothetical protein